MKILLTCVCFTGLACRALFAQDGAVNSIDLTQVDVSTGASGFQVNGKNPRGPEIGANSRELTLGGQPWIPVVGEFHFVRYPHEQWEEELLKMKAGGITVVSTYVFWIYHEEAEGKWNWSGDRDLRAFVELCQKHSLMVSVRIGPWAHGEVRNGGFPDWLLQKCGKNVRQDKQPYLGYVHAFYQEIAEQLHGLFWKDGGPICDVQLENELTGNPAHLLTLKAMALEVGIDAPFYTATGWMRAKLPENEILPVFGGYPDAFWSRDSTRWARESRANFFFDHNRDDHTIGADLAKAGAEQSGPPVYHYPYATVEMGGGMQVAYRRRPVIEADDVAALTMVKLGSGSNMQGYYMYHGGANKLGEFSTLNESRATTYPNEMPVINYDFQAPLGEYGQRRASYDALRVQHTFLRAFGSDLATLPMTMPDQRPHSMDDTGTLRWTVRSDGQRGYLFINNYQRIETLPAREDVQFSIKLKNDAVMKIPATPIRIPAQTYMIWPVNMDLGGVRLDYATAQPLCRVGNTVVFFAVDGVEPEFAFGARHVNHLQPGTDCLFMADPQNPASTKILVLTQAQARQSYQTNVWGAERLFLSKAGLVFDGDTLRAQSRQPEDLAVAVYPPGIHLVQTRGRIIRQRNGQFETYQAEAPSQHKITLEWKQIKPAEPAGPIKLDNKNVPLQPDDADFAQRAGVWQVSIPKDALENAHQVFLRINYVGDVGRAYVGDRLVDDDFYFGRTWEIGLNRFAPAVLAKGIALKILPLRQDAPIYIPKDRLPNFGGKNAVLDVRSIDLEAEYEVVFHPDAE